MEKILKLDKANNLKKNSENYNELIHEIENYQNVTEKELEIIQEFFLTSKVYKYRWKQNSQAK